MRTFFDEIQDLIVPHGVAAERLNKDLEKYVVSVYVRGMRAGVNLAMKDELFDVKVAEVEKLKTPLIEE